MSAAAPTLSSRENSKRVARRHRSDGLDSSTNSQRSSDVFSFNTPNSLFNTSVAVVTSLGLGTVLASMAHNVFGGVLALGTAFVALTWYRIHGIHLTRTDHLFFDETNLLQAMDLVGHSGSLSAAMKDCDTPIDGIERKLGPTSFWDMLFWDQGEIEIQQLYRAHYGGVFERARRTQLESESFKGGSVPVRSDSTQNSGESKTHSATSPRSDNTQHSGESLGAGGGPRSAILSDCTQNSGESRSDNTQHSGETLETNGQLRSDITQESPKPASISNETLRSDNTPQSVASDETQELSPKRTGS